MKLTIKIIQVVLIILLGFCLFMWMVYHGSGHNIPLETDRDFEYTIGILISLLILLYGIKFTLKNKD